MSEPVYLHHRWEDVEAFVSDWKVKVAVSLDATDIEGSKYYDGKKFGFRRRRICPWIPASIAD